MTQDHRSDKDPTAGPLPGSEAGLPGRGRPRTDWVVFGVTAVLTLAFVLWGAVWTDSLEDVSTDLLGGLMHNGGWGFILAASGFVVFALWLAASRYGRITLGAEGEEPEFRTVSWIAMMFSAGMGIGLMFWGVSEPLAHFDTPPPGTGPQDSGDRMSTAMATTLFHWTLHPWAIYAVVGLAIAYSTFRRRRRQTVSAVFTPLIGEKHANGAGGRVIDVLAIIATVFGSAASLGLGALQIGSGVEKLDWLEKVGTGLLVSIIAVLTVAFVASAVSGVEKGIQWLSNINMVLALLLAVFVFVAYPTVLVLDLLPTSVFTYLGDLPEMVSRTDISGGEGVADWLGSWTVFYWAWWISWTPFVGMFIARISRGRTIRQFIGGVILVPSAVSLVWFAVFGGSAMRLQEQNRLGDETTPRAYCSPSSRSSPRHRHQPAGDGPRGHLLRLGRRRGLHRDGHPLAEGLPRTQPLGRGVLGVVTGAVAAIMLLVGSGQGDALTGLQNLTILAAAPFVVVMIFMCVALMRDLRHDPLVVRDKMGSEAVELAVIEGHKKYDGEFELRVGPGRGPDVEGDPIGKH